MARIEAYDATLRDGMGGGGMWLTAKEKLRVVHALDALGVHMIEAGFPASNPKELEFFEMLEREPPVDAEIVAFGMTRRRDRGAEEDEGLIVLADSFAPICTLVGKSSPLHVEKVVRVTREENLAMIAESIAFLRARGKRVLFDAEHFFDGHELDAAYALQTLRAASEAGAERLVLCDTNGGTLPLRVQAVVEAVRAELPEVMLGIHTHDDCGCAVANTLLAVQAGATQVQGTVNGIGERTGNANLLTVLADLQLKMGHEVLAPERMARLTETSHLVDELLNRPPHASQPYVGRHAFAHKAGLHAAGIRADATTFEHIDPELVGNARDIIVSDLAGRATVMEKAARAGIELDEAGAARTIERVKALENEGFQFEAADGSFELVMRQQAGVYRELFLLLSWRVIVEKRFDSDVESEATIKIVAPPGPYEGEFIRTAEGTGPVHALDNALREALEGVYPNLRNVELVNFKVRILDETTGTRAFTRVLIDATDGQREWGSIGVSRNVIEASWDALVDSLTVAIQNEVSSVVD